MRSSVRPECSREPGKLLLGGRSGYRINSAGESVPELPDDRNVIVSGDTGLLRHGSRRKHGLDRFATQRSGGGQLRGIPDAPARIRTSDPQGVSKDFSQVDPTELPRNMLGHKLIDDQMSRARDPTHEGLDTAKNGETIALRQSLGIEFRQRVDGMGQPRKDLTCVHIHHRTHVRMIGRHPDKWSPHVADVFVVTQVISGTPHR